MLILSLTCVLSWRKSLAMMSPWPSSTWWPLRLAVCFPLPPSCSLTGSASTEAALVLQGTLPLALALPGQYNCDTEYGYG